MTGDVFPANPGAVVYNFLGSGRTITLTTSFSGNILAPHNIIYQQQGVVIGKVIAGDIPLIHQVNIVHCPKPAPITLVTYSNCPIQQGDTRICFRSDGGFIPGLYSFFLDMINDISCYDYFFCEIMINYFFFCR